MSEPSTQLLVFQVGARVFACNVHDVVRIGSVHDVAPEELVDGTCLGTTFGHDRGVVVHDHGDGSQATLVVDQVLGVRSVAESEVHPLPPFAAACLGAGVVAGLVFLDDAPTLLVDLPTLIRERRPAAPAAA